MAEQKLVWIIGGSGAIGFACATLLAEHGYSLALSGREEKKLNDTVSSNSIKNTSVLAAPCDIASIEQVAGAYKAIVDHFGKAPDVLINSAGISPWSTFSETTTQEFDAVMNVNLRGMFLTTSTVLPDMYARRSGTIVQVLSVAAIQPFKKGAAYIASKYGARGLTNALREEARAYGVRVIGIIPGATETEIWSEDDRARYHSRMMQPEDVAQAILAAILEPIRAVMEEIILRPLEGDI